MRAADAVPMGWERVGRGRGEEVARRGLLVGGWRLVGGKGGALEQVKDGDV